MSTSPVTPVNPESPAQQAADQRQARLAYEQAHYQQLKPAKREAQLHYEEGKSPAAWTGSLTALLGFLVLTAGAMLGPSRALLGLGAALLVIAGIATLLMKAQGYGSRPRDL